PGHGRLAHGYHARDPGRLPALRPEFLGTPRGPGNNDGDGRPPAPPPEAVNAHVDLTLDTAGGPRGGTDRNIRPERALIVRRGARRSEKTKTCPPDWRSPASGPTAPSRTRTPPDWLSPARGPAAPETMIVPPRWA